MMLKSAEQGRSIFDPTSEELPIWIFLVPTSSHRFFGMAHEVDAYSLIMLYETRCNRSKHIQFFSIPAPNKPSRFPDWHVFHHNRLKECDV